MNTTSRVCSTGESGHITISETAYDQLKGNSSDLNFNKRETEVI